MSCKEDSIITGLQKLLIRKPAFIMSTAIVWVPTTLLTSETGHYSYFLLSPRLPLTPKSQESNRTSQISLMCTEIQAYGYMSPFGPLVNQMTDFSAMQTLEEEESPDIRHR
jgi:hypothetical protein